MTVVCPFKVYNTIKRQSHTLTPIIKEGERIFLTYFFITSNGEPQTSRRHLVQ